MIPQPLHPAVVHFPIVLALLLPVVAIIGLIMIRRGADVRRSWLPTVGVAIALAGSSWLAVQTGEHEEEAVEEVVAERPIHDHEEAAEVFLALSVVTMLLVTTGLSGGRVGNLARPVATAATVLSVGLTFQVGHTGGELVYEHGAASAYVAGTDAYRPDSDDSPRHRDES